MIYVFMLKKSLLEQLSRDEVYYYFPVEKDAGNKVAKFPSDKSFTEISMKIPLVNFLIFF
jgi:hypothetical protein